MAGRSYVRTSFELPVVRPPETEAAATGERGRRAGRLTAWQRRPYCQVAVDDSNHISQRSWKRLGRARIVFAHSRSATACKVSARASLDDVNPPVGVDPERHHFHTQLPILHSRERALELRAVGVFVDGICGAVKVTCHRDDRRTVACNGDVDARQNEFLREIGILGHEIVRTWLGHQVDVVQRQVLLHPGDHRKLGAAVNAVMAVPKVAGTPGRIRRSKGKPTLRMRSLTKRVCSRSVEVRTLGRLTPTCVRISGGPGGSSCVAW